MSDIKKIHKIRCGPGKMYSQQSATTLHGNEDFVILVFKVHRENFVQFIKYLVYGSLFGGKRITVFERLGR